MVDRGAFAPQTLQIICRGRCPPSARLTGLALFIFRLCTGNHPSVTCGDSSPQGAPISYLMFAVAPLEGWFLAANLTPVGWFPTQGLKINRTTATYAQKIYSPITHHRGRAKPGPPPVYDGLSLYTLLVNCKIVLPCGGRIRRGSSFSGSAARQHRPQPAAHQCR